MITETDDKLKALIGEDDRTLGFTAFAPRAGELLHGYIELARSTENAANERCTHLNQSLDDSAHIEVPVNGNRKLRAG